MWQIIIVLCTFPIMFILTTIPIVLFFMFKIGIWDVLLMAFLFKSDNKNKN